MNIMNLQNVYIGVNYVQVINLLGILFVSKYSAFTFINYNIVISFFKFFKKIFLVFNLVIIAELYTLDNLHLIKRIYIFLFKI